jgi:hypothetical protein
MTGADMSIAADGGGLFTKTFWANTIERVVRTAATTGLGAFVADKATDTAQIDWKGGLLLVGTSALGTLLLCLAGKKVGDPQSPSFLLKAPAGKA